MKFVLKSRRFVLGVIVMFDYVVNILVSIKLSREKFRRIVVIIIVIG